MIRLLLSVGLVFSLTGCDSIMGPSEPEVIVVPVPDGGGDKGKEEGDFCCKYKGESGDQYALAEGPSECKAKHGDDAEWVSGSQCIPCCCKSPNDAEDEEKGFTFEMTTPTACNATGECTGADECSEKKEEPKYTGPKKVRKPSGGTVGGPNRHPIKKTR